MDDHNISQMLNFGHKSVQFPLGFVISKCQPFKQQPDSYFVLTTFTALTVLELPELALTATIYTPGGTMLPEFLRPSHNKLWRATFH